MTASTTREHYYYHHPALSQCISLFFTVQCADYDVDGSGSGGGGGVRIL